MSQTEAIKNTELSVDEILYDYQIACESRNASIIGRKEVFMGKAKFGIFGDGKEVAQIAMAKAFKNGDFRSGYYRDQTFMMAIGELTIEAYFAQLYAHTDVWYEPSSAGRLMNGHFSTRLLDEEGNWHNLSERKNSSADVSCTAAQMPRLVGLAYASKLYRENPDLHQFTGFSNQGNEVAFGTIGNAATSEGQFFESINAAGVLQIPMLVAVWDDEYGISVPKEFHTTRGEISLAMEGFQRTKKDKGIQIFVVNGWDYLGLCDTFEKAAELSRKKHIPTLIHVKEMTQPLGHSTSGSHERYKSKERLAWEDEFDCIRKMREWIISQDLATEEALNEIEHQAQEKAKKAKNNAWKAFLASTSQNFETSLELLENLAENSDSKLEILAIHKELKNTLNPLKLDIIKAVKKVLRLIRKETTEEREDLIQWLDQAMADYHDEYSSNLYSESAHSALKVPEIPMVIDEGEKFVDGKEVLQACFDAALSRDPRVFAIGEDIGKIGDVNQGFAGLQELHGNLRVTDTGIRETTIIGQGIGAALRGLRPIAEIQYIDYLLYAIQILSDDLSTLQYRTKGGQKSPLIIRTRGHRLEGVWHSGSPISMILGSLRGIYLLVPRNMTKAAGMYNTMLLSDDTALLIECLNGYRLKEQIPSNIGEFTVPLGVPEIIREGTDITLVTYGSMCRIVLEAAMELESFGISCEVIDVQTLLPFDVHHHIVESIKKTNRVAFLDEDVPGGATAYMMQKVVEEQNAYYHLDSQPITISSKPHRPAYSSDGDYFSKPNVEEIFDRVYLTMSESDPVKYPPIY